jgi:hypothetical protein
VPLRGSSPRSLPSEGVAACRPQALEIYDRDVGVQMDPQYSDPDLADIIAAVRKVYGAVIS